ncbi:hypothetical protein Noda2021_01530 [Candidatus Dependentiae bacterium Noda2021]|nr:hypothetical protein Noda2021_01530 [Candidatus Dependentiae bacterium Noda2021]
MSDVHVMSYHRYIYLLVCHLLLAACSGQGAVTIHRVSAGTLEHEEALFVRAFCHGYADIPVSILKIDDVPARARSVFNVEHNDLNDSQKNIFFLTAYVDDSLAGLITFQEYGADTICYIRALAVDPVHMRQGIGKLLVFSVAKYLPNVKEIVLATRACNTGARMFYDRLGFHEYDEVPFNWDPALFIGLKFCY